MNEFMADLDAATDLADLDAADLDAADLDAADLDAADLDAADSLLREIEGMDLVEVLHGMSGHYHEHWSELLGWPWKRFCANWARMVDYMAEDRAKREERERHQRLRDVRALAGGMAGPGE